MKKKVGILCSCFVMMSYLGMSPIIADVHHEFPDIDVSAVQMLITLPSLMALVFSLVAGRLAARIYKKTLILAAMGAYLVGGLVPLVFNGSLWILLACSAVMGIGTGIMITTTSAIICDYYEGRERSRMMGLQAAFISGGGMIFTLLGGALASFGWRQSYLAFLLMIPCLIVAVRCLPKGILETAPAKKTRGGIPGYVWFMSLIGFLFYVFQNIYNTNIALYMEETGLGSAQTASIATSLNTFGGILAGVLLGQVMTVMKKHTITVAVITSGVGLLLAFAGTSLPLIIFGGFLVGFGFSSFTPAGTCLVSENVAAQQRSMAIAVFSASTNVGAALSPVIVNAMTEVIAPGAGVEIKFIVGAVVLGIVACLAAAKIFMEKSTQDCLSMQGQR